MSKNLRLLIIILILLVCPCLLALGAVGVYTYQNRDVSEEDGEQEVDAPEKAEDLPLKDYSEEWTGRITLAPIDAPSFIKKINVDEDCDLPDGVISYSLELYGDAMIISNKNLKQTTQEQEDFADVSSVVNGDEKIMIREDSPSFSMFDIYCEGADFTYLEEIDTKYPNTEASNGFVFFGGMQAVASTPEELPVTVAVYAKRGDNMIYLVHYFDGDELFTDMEAKTCEQSMDGGKNMYLDLDCMKRVYLNATDKQAIVKDKTEVLIETFALPD